MIHLPNAAINNAGWCAGVLIWISMYMRTRKIGLSWDAGIHELLILLPLHSAIGCADRTDRENQNPCLKGSRSHLGSPLFAYHKVRFRLLLLHAAHVLRGPWVGHLFT